jgi:PAS domain S-box-containing protein
VSGIKAIQRLRNRPTDIRERARELAKRLKVCEASLKESETRFQTLADTAPVLMWMSGPDKLCTFFNKGWLEFTGRTIERELGNGWAEGVHPDDLEQCWKAYVSAFAAREPFTLQYRLRHHDGVHRWIADKGVARYDLEGNFLGYIGACVDITDLLKKERALREFEERVTLAAEAARFGVWELDIGTNEIWMSEKARELFQFQPGTTVNYAAFQERVHPEDRARRDSNIRRAIEEKGEYEMEYRALLPDGTIRWIGARARCRADENGYVTLLLGISMDVTERKQAEELFHLATEASPSGTLLVDEEGRIVLANAHVEELFGYKHEDLVGAPIETLLPERYAAKHPGYRANFFHAPQARPMGAGRELFARRKDGTEFPVEIGLNPIQTSRGILVLGSVVDISARKRAEEEARRRREQLDLLARVSLLGEMTASLAHELNQPLAAIVNNASAGMEVIENGNGDPAALREILADVAADGCRAHEIIRNVRNTIKKGSAVRQPLSLNYAVQTVTRLVQPDAMAQSCEVETLLAKDLPAIIGDPVQIEQVLINLVTNAFDAMRDTPAGKRKVEIVTERNCDASVRLTVRDKGSGISEDIKERLFEQFYTTKSEGLGMGLAIARSIVESHGGRIEAENVLGGGAEFYFTLPIITST